MSKFGVGQPVPRSEDPRFLTGRGRYVGDICWLRFAFAYEDTEADLGDDRLALGRDQPLCCQIVQGDADIGFDQLSNIIWKLLVGDDCYIGRVARFYARDNPADRP